MLFTGCEDLVGDVPELQQGSVKPVVGKRRGPVDECLQQEFLLGCALA